MKEVTYRNVLKCNIMQTTIAKLQLMFMWYICLDVKGGTSITSNPVNLAHVFFYLYDGGGVQLGPLSTVATNRPIVPAPGDYDGEIGGMIIGRGN
jgi:hypothetical protein